MPPVIRFENVGKLYRLGTVGTGTISHDLRRWWITSVRHKEDPYLKIGETNDLRVSRALFQVEFRIGKDCIIEDWRCNDALLKEFIGNCDGFHNNDKKIEEFLKQNILSVV